MKKATTSFVCQECGYESTQWLGKCPECGVWNSLKEFKIPAFAKTTSDKQNYNSKLTDIQSIKPQALKDIATTSQDRLQTGFAEMDSVLGGGIVKGSVILLAGDPGVGKSTLLLQLVMYVGQNVIPAKAGIQENAGSQIKSGMTNKKNVLYISGEESKEQIAMRANRIKDVGISSENLLLVSMTSVDAIAQIIEETKPSLVIVDSIQTIESEQVAGMSGSIGQIRFAAQTLIRLAKTLNIPMIIVGHVTKEGMVAGPMILSHMVDTVLFLEGEKFTATRILRSLKNRFGPVDEVGIFLMESGGMQEVKNPEQIFLDLKETNVPGSVLVVIMEGTRPFLIEIQALVVSSYLPMPRRVAQGVDSRRVELLLAVLQKHCRLPLATTDVFVNIAGGIRVTDPAVDLGICLAIYSSFKNKALGKTVGIAEVGLLGELRKVPFLDKRIKEAKKLGFSKIITGNDHKYLSKVLEAIDK